MASTESSQLIPTIGDLAYLFGLVGMSMGMGSVAYYSSAQRILLTGRLKHFELGKRLWQPVLGIQMYASLAVIIMVMHLMQRSGILGQGGVSVGMCQAVFITSHYLPAFYTIPYLLRGWRLAVLYDTSLRAKYRCWTSGR